MRFVSVFFRTRASLAVRLVAAPIFDSAGGIRAFISITKPMHLVSPAKEEDIQGIGLPGGQGDHAPPATGVTVAEGAQVAGTLRSLASPNGERGESRKETVGERSWGRSASRHQ